MPLSSNATLNAAGHQATLVPPVLVPPPLQPAPPPNPTSGGGGGGGGGGMPVLVEEVMKVYAGVGGMSLEARLRATNEAKVKNFRNWLNVGLAGR